TQKTGREVDDLELLRQKLGLEPLSVDYSTKFSLSEVETELKKLSELLKGIYLSRKKEFMSEWMSGDEVLCYLKISTGTFRTWRGNGTLPYSKIEHKFYFRKEDVEKLLKKNYNGAAKR
ncbi:MAG TPA: helix-turn-helix domain-containing protein, partial [Bacteroidales bacterium]